MQKRSLLMAVVASAMLLPANAQEKYELGKPGDSNYTYLNEYGALKDYIDRSKYPNFKLGIGTTVNDYLNKGIVYKMTNANFNETVAGNAMKMSSCVSNNGTMNFSTVTRYVNEATSKGLNVYGHTLAWHSQQPIGWLGGLIQDKPAPELTDGDVTVYQEVASKDFRTNQTIGWHADYTQYGFSISFDATNGLKAHTTKKVNSWEVQYIAMDNIPVVAGETYRMTMTVKGSGSGKIHTKLGDWSTGATGDVSFGTTWQDVTITYKANVNNSFLLLQHGDFVGDIYIQKITFEKTAKGKTIEEDRRCLGIEATERQSEAWDNQFWVLTGTTFPANCNYEFSAEIRADKPAKASTQIHTVPGTYVHYEALGDIYFTTEWKTIHLSGKFSQSGQSIAFNLSELADANTYYFDNVSLKINGVERVKNGTLDGTDVSSFKCKKQSGSVVAPTIVEHLTYVYVPSTIPLSQEERHDTLVWAMDKWIKGMMNACGGKVKAWDVVNEAISGGGDDGQGNYTLQHSSGYNSGTWDVGGDAFYWQDHMGDLEYVRQAVRLARKYGPSDIKLFINDYNLESDWDGNKKLKSLINWIKKWEADGVTVIDGIGTQMHISYYENSGTQTSKKNAITNMFKLMAATGKLVRVSEFDMGYVNAAGNNVATSQMTETQHKNMANFYEWIIKEYLRLIPADQQWGICQWCPTDSPANSGWRANTPVGIWDLNYYRKHVYAGYVRGLGGVLNSLDGVEAEEKPLEGIVFNLNGVRMNATSVNELPAGIYVVNGKKIIKK